MKCFILYIVDLVTFTRGIEYFYFSIITFKLINGPYNSPGECCHSLL